MVIFENKTDTKIDLARLSNISDTLTTKDIDLTITNNKEMQEINKEHRGIDKTTDVLSFPLEDFPHSPLGSIVINIELAKSVASKLGHSVDEEVALLFIHGLLHLLGYDHEVDSGQMREMEERLIEEFKLPKSLIIRGDDDS